MKRKMVAAGLLPMPFIALPVAAVLFGGVASPARDGVVLQTPRPLERPVERILSTGAPGETDSEAALAYGTTSRGQRDCNSGPESEG